MQDPRTRIIESAIRPLEEGTEMKAAARNLLGEVVEPESPDAEAVVRRWEETDAKKRRPWWSISWLLLVLVTLGTVISDQHEISRYVAWRGWIGGFTSWPDLDEELVARLRPEQKLLASTDQSEALERCEALWNSSPDNPAFFSEYACVYFNTNKSLPPDFLKIVSRIDPDNSWFTYLMASAEGKESVQQGIDLSNNETWTALDQGRLDRATELLRKARAQPRFESYSADMIRLRLVSEPARSRIEQMDRLPLLSSLRAPITRMLESATVINFRLWKATQENDTDAFRTTMVEADHLIGSLLRNQPGTILEGVILRGHILSTGDRISKSGIKLGLEEEVGKWTRVVQQMKAIKEAGRSRESALEDRQGNPQLMATSLFGTQEDLSILILKTPLKLTDNDVKPGRLLDHEILSRFCSYFLWIVMAAYVVVLAAYRLRVSRLGWFLAGRAERILDGRDYGWIIGAGIVLPFAWVFLVNRLTPLGGRDFGMMGTALLLPAFHFAGLFVLWLVVPGQVAHWRLGKRAGALGFRRSGIFGWIAVACAAAFIPLIGWAAITRSYPDYWTDLVGELAELPEGPLSAWRFHLALGVGAIPLIWIFSGILQAVLSRAERLMHHATLTRILVKPSVAGMILLMLAVHGLKSAERYWFDRDQISKTDPAKPGWSVQEYEVAARLNQELREIVEGGR